MTTSTAKTTTASIKYLQIIPPDRQHLLLTAFHKFIHKIFFAVKYLYILYRAQSLVYGLVHPAIILLVYPAVLLSLAFKQKKICAGKDSQNGHHGKGDEGIHH